MQKIQDEFTDLPLGRSRKNQLRHTAMACVNSATGRTWTATAANYIKPKTGRIAGKGIAVTLQPRGKYDSRAIQL